MDKNSSSDTQSGPHDSSRSHCPSEPAKDYVNLAYVDDSGESGLPRPDTTSAEVSPSPATAPEEGQGNPGCGLHTCKPKSMQVCANLACFTACYCMAAVLTQTLNVYLTSQITSIEKQFGFSNSEIGVIMSGNDIGFLVTVLFISHFAKKANIPRWLGGSTFLFGMSGLVCSLAYFVNQKDGLDILSNDTTPVVSQKYDMNILLCNTTEGHKKMGDDSPECSIKNGQNKAFVMFMIGMLVQGVAKSPRTPLVTAYMDNNVVEKTKTGLYMGIVYSMTIFGPSLAFLTGGIFSQIPVDLKDRGLNPDDPRWIGAWWIGFVLFGLAAAVVSVPLFFFPKSYKVNSNPKEDETIPDQKSNVLSRIKDLPISLWRVSKNPVYDLTILSICILIFGVAGTLAFTQKYVEHQFAQPTWKANIILGVEKMVGSAMGTFLGGLFTAKLKLSRRGCLKLKIAIVFVCACLEALGFLFGCPRSNINGFVWKDEPGFKKADFEETRPFYPVCGSDGLNYFSPCVAECTAFNQTLNVFTSCQCIGNGGTSTPGLCDTGCPFLYPYITGNLFGSFIGTFAIIPGYMILLRSVLDEDKTIAIGMMSFLVSLFGWLPGPIVFGRLIDSTCALWSVTCGKKGECILYDIKDMRLKVHTLTVSVQIIGGLVLIAAYVVAYAEDKRLLKKEQPQNTCSQTIILRETKSPERQLKADNTIPTVERDKNEQDRKISTVSNGDISAGDNVSSTRLDPMSTRL